MIWLGSSRGWAWNLRPIQPWHSLLPLVAPGHNSVGEGEERRGVAALFTQALQVELVLMIQHRLETSGRHVPVGLAVDGVAHRHVVSRDRLGDRACCAADPKEPARHFLARTDLGDGAVPARIEVDPQRLLMGVFADVDGHRTPGLPPRVDSPPRCPIPISPMLAACELRVNRLAPAAHIGSDRPRQAQAVAAARPSFAAATVSAGRRSRSRAPYLRAPACAP